MPPARRFRPTPCLLSACLAALLLALAAPAAAQNPAGHATDPTPTVAVLTWRGTTDAEKGFKEEMAYLGYRPRYIEMDAGQDPARLEANLSALAQEKPDLIYTFGTTVTLAALRTFTDRPIVFSMVSNPDLTGIMNTVEGSGHNVAGATHAVAESSLLNLLLELVPARTVGILYNPQEKNSQVTVERLRQLSRRAGVELAEQELLPDGDPKAAAEALAGQGAEAVILPSDSLVVSRGKEIVHVFNSRRIPTVAALEPYVLEQEALVGLVASYEDTGREAARVADRILRGEEPAGIPLAYVRPRHIVNQRTAKRLGMAIPGWITHGSATIVQ